jgi:hypothetical protein
MNREQTIVEIERLVAERRRINAELDQILGTVATRRGRPPGARSAPPAPKRQATRKRRGLSKGSLAFRIHDVLKHSAKAMNAGAVAIAIGEKRVPVVSSTMNRLKTTGYLKRASRGRYSAG